MRAQLLCKFAICMAFFLGVDPSYAQQPRIPLGQIQQSAQSTAPAPAPNSPPENMSSQSPTELSSSAAPSFSSQAAWLHPQENPAVQGLRNPRVVNTSFLLLNSLHLTLALVDVEESQHCIDQHTCVEANPLMPSSHAGKLALNLGMVAYAASASYYLKKHTSGFWWLPPLAGIGFHSGGVASGIAH
jgi:hypothetical protein